jgi:nicotinamidase/pyrazinamidase
MIELDLFVDVDTQRDFMDPDGKLPVPGAAEIVPNLLRLTQFAQTHGIPILATADSHPPGDPEFEEFGEHCIPGSPGHARIAATQVAESEVAVPGRLHEQARRLLSGELRRLVVRKGQLDPFQEPAMNQAVAELRPARAFVYGVATEYCVRLAVLGLRQRGCPVTVVADAIRPIEHEAGTAAMAEMQASGAEFASTDAVMEMLKSREDA